MHPLAVHHIGHAVSDLDAAVDLYTGLLGAVFEHRTTLADQGVEAATVQLGDSRIELVTPTGDDTPVGRFLARRGPGMHHVAVQVPDIRSAIAEAEASGAHVIDSEPRRGILGLEVAFIHPESVAGVLVELVQTTDGADRG